MKDVNQKEKVNSAKSVSFENQEGQTVFLYAGAANFGLPLNLGFKVIYTENNTEGFFFFLSIRILYIFF